MIYSDHPDEKELRTISTTVSGNGNGRLASEAAVEKRENMFECLNISRPEEKPTAIPRSI